MNLDRISIKVSDDLFMTLAKISDFSKLYTTIWVKDLTMQKINTGNSIQAFSFKNIEQFKGLRPFQDGSQDEISLAYSIGGAKFSYETKLHSGDLVRYNGLKYVVLGIVVNTYAQWNMPTPLLFNPTNVNNDYKSLYGSKLTREQINKKINDNFQSGKYDADMVIPLVDANDFSEYITIIQPRPTKEEVQLMFDSVKAEKDLTIKSQKDVFIDTMLRLRGNEINQIKEVNEDLFKGVQTLLLSVNKAVNEQIELLPEPVKEKPARKPRAKKVVEEIEPIIEAPQGLFDVMNVFYLGGTSDKKFKNTSDLYEHLRKKFKTKTQTVATEVPIFIEYSDAGDWLTKKVSFIATMREPQGYEFNFETMSSDDFLVMLDALFPQYDWEGFNDKAKSKLPKTPEVTYQEVEAVELVVYPPVGSVVNVKTESLYELHDIIKFTISKFKMKDIFFNVNVITDLQTLTSKINFNVDYSQDGVSALLHQYFDKLAYLNWKNFDERQGDIALMELNEEIVNGAFEVEKSKPVPVEKPKPVDKPKPVKVEKPKPVSKPKVTKPKVTKPKVEDDLSFLDDLDNIF
jgi:hypothetical protein